VLPVPLSRMVSPYALCLRQKAEKGGTEDLIPVTNAIESLNAKLRRAVRARGHFPTDDSAMKLLFLVLNLAAKDWKMPAREWAMAKAQLAILFEGRFKLA
jgi:putative transposase